MGRNTGWLLVISSGLGTTFGTKLPLSRIFKGPPLLILHLELC